MKSELIVDVRPNEVSIALLEDSRLVSLQKEKRDISYAVGDVYLAKVKKLMPGLNAAFVQVGYEKDAFLHYLDLGAQFASYAEFVGRLLDDRRHIPSISRMKLLPDIDKHGTIADRLTPGQELLVQIVKEPISSKGPRLTTELTFTGRYMVLIPFSDKISVSQKIKSTAEKVRLRQLVESIKPKNFGVIIRTSAEGKRVAELNNELKTLLECWEQMLAKAQRSQAPSLVFEEESRIVGMLRDVFSPSFESIRVNDKEIASQIEKYVKLIAPESPGIVSYYDKEEPIFDHFGITRQIKSSFGKTVSFRSGAYIIIEHTEALHVIDVNSGNRAKGTNDQETNALEVNMRAAEEIARQLRLRDMGGIIVVDFIDMYNGEHRQQLFEHMRQVMANDRARHNILPLSKFGLMQITRQRVRPVLDIATTETCPSCFGKGEVQPSLLFTDTLHEKLDYLVNTLKKTDFVMYVHPFVEAYIKRGLFTSLYGKWRRELGRRFKIVADQSLAYLEYRVIDSDRNEIDLKEEKDLNESSLTKTRNKASIRSAQAQDAAIEAAAQEPSSDPAADADEPKPKKKAKKKKKKSAGTAENTAEVAAENTADPAEDSGPALPPVEIRAKIVKAKATSDDTAENAENPTEPTATPSDTPAKKRRRKKSDNADQSDQSDQSDKPDKSDQSDSAEGSETPKKPKRPRKKRTNPADNGEGSLFDQIPETPVGNPAPNEAQN